MLIRPGRELLAGPTEVDETYIGGKEPGLAGGRAKGKKTLVAVAVEVHEPKGFGRARMRVIADASTATLSGFIADTVEPGAIVVTDGWPAYRRITAAGFTHEPRNQSAAKALGEDPGTLLPDVHRVASLAKRWLAATHQGAVEKDQLQSYLNEFCFRFNRRHSRARGMLFYRVLELAVGHQPVRFCQLIANPKPKPVPPSPLGGGGHPPSLDQPRAIRQSRNAPTSISPVS